MARGAVNKSTLQILCFCHIATCCRLGGK